jgi:hypothetical protein
LLPLFALGPLVINADTKYPSPPPPRHPSKNSDIKFIVAQAGKPVSTVCPGGTYSVTVQFPDARMALLTASAGKFAAPGIRGDEELPECANRVFFDRSGGFAAKAVQSMDLAVPCSCELVLGGGRRASILSLLIGRFLFWSLVTKLQTFHLPHRQQHTHNTPPPHSTAVSAPLELRVTSAKGPKSGYLQAGVKLSVGSNCAAAAACGGGGAKKP